MARIDLIQLRRGTAAEWSNVDPVLDAGEPGVATDTGVLKVGDGTSKWSDLPSIEGYPSPIPGAAGHLILSDGAGDATWTPDTLTEIIDDARSPGPWVPLDLSPAADPGVSAGWVFGDPWTGMPRPIQARRSVTGDVQARGGVMWLDATGNPSLPPAGDPLLGGLLPVAELPPELAPPDDGYPTHVSVSWGSLSPDPPTATFASVGDFGDGPAILVSSDGTYGPLLIINTATWEAP